MGHAPDTLAIPGCDEAIDLALPPHLARLRERALNGHRGPRPSLPENPLADAAAWAEHTPEEPWLVWRGRRTAARLRAMPFAVDPGEPIVGRPQLRTPRDHELLALAAAAEALADEPVMPAGDTGHFHPDYETLFRAGIAGLADEVARRRDSAADAETAAFYDACRITLDAFADFSRRAADAADDPAAAAACRHVASRPPRTFRQAIQLMFLTQVACWFGEDHYLTAPGRMDRTLAGFYRDDVAAGRLSRREAFELICCLFIHMNYLLWPGSAVSVMVGGRDAHGADVTNELTYLCLAARRATRLVYPTVGLAWHEGTPDELMAFATDMLAAGTGDPAFFHDDLIAVGLGDLGVPPADRRNYMNSTCVEIKVVGASNIWVTQPYFNLPQCLLDVLDAAAGEGAAPATFDDLQARVEADLAARIRTAAEARHVAWLRREEVGGFPLASCLTRDCLSRGRDFDRGGARYNWVENSFVGLANLADSLLAVRELVYDRGEMTLGELHGILETDFAGHEPLRLRLATSLPKYGNDDDRADALARRWAEFCIAETRRHTVGLARYVPGFFCWIQHERLGSQTGATPDGRRAGEPLAPGAGAAQGRDRRGPTASVLSTTKWSHRSAMGGLVHNLRFSAGMLADPAGRAAFRGVVETYLRRGGFEVQVNVVSHDMLLDARENPEAHRDLLVRVAGYSDYFVHLNPNLQAEIIARTEHGAT